MIQWAESGITPSVTSVAAARITAAIVVPNDFLAAEPPRRPTTNHHVHRNARLAAYRSVVRAASIASRIEALADHRSLPNRVWNRIPEPVWDEIVELALRETELSPRGLAVRSTDEKRYFASEASVYRLLSTIHDPT